MQSNEQKRFTLKQKGLFVVSALLLIELTLVFALGALLLKAEDVIHSESRARDILACVNYIYVLKKKAEDSADYFVGTGKAELPKRFHATVPLLQTEMTNLRTLTSSSPSAQQADQLIASLDKNLKFWSDMVRLRSSANQRDWDVAGRMRSSPTRETDNAELSHALLSFQDSTKNLLEKQNSSNLSTQSNVMLWIGLAMMGNVALALLLALLFAKGITSRIAVLVDNTKLMAEEKALKDPLKQTDEIGDLDHVFHMMASTLQQALGRDRALTENAMDVIFTIQDSKITKINPASVENWGFAPAELIGAAPSKLLPPNQQEVLSQLTTCKSSIELETQLQRKDGKLIDTLWVAQWSETENSLFCVAHDVTERKKEEQLLASNEMRLRTVLDTMLVGLMTVTESGLIKSANPRLEQITRYEKEELNGRSLDYLFPTLSTESLALLAATEQVKEEGDEATSVQTVELNALTKQGGSVPVELSVGRLQMSGENIFLITIIDISARRELQQAKQEFVGMISEDLATPLTSVRDFLEVLSKDSSLNQTGHDRSVLAANNVGRLLRLLDDLFEINELESGQLELRPSMISMQDVITKSMDAVSVFAENHSVTMESMKTACTTYADGDRLERVLVNLLSNAIKFSPEGATVEIKVLENDETFKLNVVDRGRGIPASHIDKIFAAFKQVKDSDATKKGGTGLGLAICKAVIEQHGGTIGVESIEGEGSTFWFEIPIQRSASTLIP